MYIYMCVFRIFEISTNPLSLISFQPGQVRQRSSSPAAGKLSVTFSAKHRMAVSQNPGPLRNIFRNIWFMDVYISPMVIIGFDPSLCHGGKLYNYTVYNICNIYIYTYIQIQPIITILVLVIPSPFSGTQGIYKVSFLGELSVAKTWFATVYGR